MFLILTGFLSWQVYKLYGQKARLSDKVEKLEKETAALFQENQEVAQNIEYYKNPENLAKELKSKFDYKRPGEELYIIVPKK